MEIFLNYAIIIFSIAVFIVLALGVLAMARGDNFNKNWSQKLMRMRVLFQAIAILLIVLIFGFLSSEFNEKNLFNFTYINTSIYNYLNVVNLKFWFV